MSEEDNIINPSEDKENTERIIIFNKKQKILSNLKKSFKSSLLLKSKANNENTLKRFCNDNEVMVSKILFDDQCFKKNNLYSLRNEYSI